MDQQQPISHKYESPYNKFKIQELWILAKNKQQSASNEEFQLKARDAKVEDAIQVATIYNEGIEDRVATFETDFRTPDDILIWIEGSHPLVVIVDEFDEIIAFAHGGEYRPRECYRGISEFSVYVARDERSRGAGRLAMQALIESAKQLGYWKLISRIFPENEASLRLMATLGFREVGIYKNHGKLDNIWRDVVIVELLIEENL
jgi:phosphinothricin acetyltransferase